MSKASESVVLRYLRRIDGKLDSLAADLPEVARRLGTLVENLASVGRRLDRLDERLARVEYRLTRPNDWPGRTTSLEP